MSGPGATAAVHALRYWELRQEAVAHNLANVSTPGFKGERIFARLLDGAPEATAAHDFAQGSTSTTGRPLDLAISGEGFLVVQTEQGERLTRGGALSLSPEGTLVTASGDAVLGDGGPIQITGDLVQIASDGRITVDGQSAGSLRIERPSAGATLSREGDGLWRAEGGTEAVEPGTMQVLQGALEDSNVAATSAMVEMIEIQRAYAAIQRSVQVNDEASRTMSTQIGRVG